MSSSNVSMLITSLLVCGVGFIVVGLMLPLLGRDRLAVRLSELSERPRTLEELELAEPLTERVWHPLLRHLARLGGRVLGRGPAERRENAVETMRRRLNLAGNPHRWTTTEWLGLKVLTALCTGGVSIGIFAVLPLNLHLLMVVGGAFAGYLLPEFWLKRQIETRQKAIRRALPDVLDLLVIGVKGGLGFDAAVAHVISRTDNPVTEELSRMLAEMRVGRSRREALREVMARTDVPELSHLVWALIQADQLGVSTVQVLVAQAHLMRVQRRQRVQEQAQQAPLKMIAPLGIFIFPALCVVLLGPAWPALLLAFRR